MWLKCQHLWKLARLALDEDKPDDDGLLQKLWYNIAADCRSFCNDGIKPQMAGFPSW